MKTTKWYVALSYILFFVSSSWLAGPFADKLLHRGPNLISEYEANALPYAWLFRLCDLFAATIVIMLAIQHRKHITHSYSRYVAKGLVLIGILQTIDVLTPVNCNFQNGICKPVMNFSAYIHGIESYILGILMLGLALIVAYRRASQHWIPPALATCIIAGAILDGSNKSLLLGVQSTAVLINIYLLWYVLLADYFTAKKALSKHIAPLLSYLVGAGALLSLLESALHVNRSGRLKDLPFNEFTAITTQHTLISTLILLYVLRALYNNSRRAWQIVTTVVGLEVIWQATLGHTYWRLIVYLILFVTLLVCQGAFYVQHDIDRFKRRIHGMVTVMLITAVTVTLFSVVFRYHSLHAWQESAFTPLRVGERVLLLEVSDNPSDPLRARLFGQALTTIGVFMYGWIITGLFLPYIVERRSGNNASQTLDYLERYSNSSEDYFKYWPEDKQIYFGQQVNGMVAYKQKGGYLIALADPLCAPHDIPYMLSEFSDFSHRHGTVACWLMVTEARINIYQKASLLTIPIGSSAVVDSQLFSEQTIKNKWWRWKINKARNLGYEYECLAPPHSAAFLQRLSHISQAWLEKDGHEERGFALGYFDKKQLQSQIIHAVRDNQGHVVAFANQLPTFNNNKTATIDLMRYTPEHSDVIAFLLSQAIHHTFSEQGFKNFDLGFVPMAYLTEGELGSKATGILQNVIRPIFSAHGLMQFKNKFEPDWQRNYLAVDGDRLSATGALTALPGALKLDDYYRQIDRKKRFTTKNKTV